MTARPKLTLSEAADAASLSRRTLRRWLDAGRFPNAERNEAGVWVVPVEELLAAGVRLHASKPEPAPTSQPRLTPTPEPSELDRLRDELAAWRLRAEVAEAVAAERGDALADARLALRALTAGDIPEPASSSTPTPPGSTVVESPPASSSSARWVRLRRRRR